MLIGKEALARLKGSKVAVFGVGGVGSFAVEGLARAGLGKFVLIDNDCICPTNINRQIHATCETVGKYKVDVMKKRIQEINPKAEVETHKLFYLPGSSQDLIRNDYDYIVDAVDTVTAKIDIVVRAKALGIPVISCMGAGNKLDPTMFEIADIYATSVCPLAKVMRKELRKRGVDSLKVVYSRETPVKPADIKPSDGSSNACSNETSGISAVHKQVPGSISFVPSVAGLIAAGEVIKDLTGVKR